MAAGSRRAPGDRPPKSKAGSRVIALDRTTVAGYLGLVAWHESQLAALPAVLLITVSGSICARLGVFWRFRVQRRRARDSEFRLPPAADPVRAGRRFRGRFNRYFARYVPAGTDRAGWLTETAGIRRSLRDEVVEAYRETRVDVQRIAWLIRHLVADVRRGWEAGTVQAYPKELSTPVAVKAALVLGFAGLATASGWLAATAIRIEPLKAPFATLVTAFSGFAAARRWLRIAATAS